jgi:hypothetical protein
LFARYLLAIASLAFLYSLTQALRHAFRMRGGVDPISAPSGRLLDFVADQASGYSQLVLLTYNYIACYSHFCAISDSPVCIGDFDFSIQDCCSVKGKGVEYKEIKKFKAVKQRFSCGDSSNSIGRKSHQFTSIACILVQLFCQSEL